jgi:hypothetical protein
MDHDPNSDIWWPAEPEPHFPSLVLKHRLQKGGTCVSTALSLLTGEDPTTIRKQTNTQNPITWSRYLQSYGMKLAYCATDLRRLRYYVAELLAHDDLFAISTYSLTDPRHIGADPEHDGWVCSSHFFLLHRGTVFDTAKRGPVELTRYGGLGCYVKRMFRVVPVGHARGSKGCRCVA